MTTAVRADEVSALAPVTRALDAVRARRGPAAVHNVTASLVADDTEGWVPASGFADTASSPR